MNTLSAAAKPRVGVSACLLGEPVRFDGGHKRDAFLVDQLSPFVDWAPLCPELALGLGTPREALRLTGTMRAPRLGTRSGADLTERMHAQAIFSIDSMTALDGYVLKARSPSCGPDRVRVYDRNGVPSAAGRGAFASVLGERRPLLPAADEGRLHDPQIREQFVERVFTHWRFRVGLSGTPRLGDLVGFHARRTVLLLSHGSTTMRRLGRIVAGASDRSLGEALDDYRVELMRVLATAATRRRRTDALRHLAGHFSTWLDGQDRAELAEIIETYRLGRIALAVPIALLRHHLRRFPACWAADQVYLAPYPADLMLRNQV